MNNKHLVISIIVGVSFLGGSIFAFSDSSNFGSDEKVNTLSDTGFLSGHVTLVVYDEFGNIKHYQQTDNAIVNQGEDCIADYLFGAGTACTVTASDFITVALGKGTPVAANSRGTVTALVTSDTLKAGTSTITQLSTNVDEANAASKAIVDIIATFSPTVTVTYKEVALTNAAGVDFLAYQNLGDATIVGNQDSLTVTWTITIG